MLACARIGAAAHRGLRRLLRGGARRTASTTAAGQGADHRRRRLAAGQDGRPQAPRRRGARRRRPRSSTSLVVGPASATASTWSPGRDHWWHEIVDRQDDGLPARSRSTASTCSTCSTRRARRPSPRASCTPRRATCWAPRSPTGRLRRQARRRLLVRRRHRLGDRPQLHRLRAAGQRHDRGDVRGRAGHARPGTAGGRSSRSYKVTILYCAPTAIRAFMKQGEALPGAGTTCRRCGCSARSASRSTPRPGCGTSDVHRRRPGARSSTPGGRPRRARS